MTPSPATVEELVCELGTASPVYVRAGAFPAALVAEALAVGAISEWEDSPVGRAVLLSSLTTERLGLVLVDEAAEDLAASRWVARSEERPARSLGTRDLTELEVGTGSIGDYSSIDPVQILVQLEEAVEALNRIPADAGSGRVLAAARLVMAPLIFIGSTRTDWRPDFERTEEPETKGDGRPSGAKAPCPVCRGRKLSKIECCLGCLRSGVDDRLPKVPPDERPKKLPPGVAAAADDSGSGSGSGPKIGPRRKRRCSKKAPVLAGGTGIVATPRSKAKKGRLRPAEEISA